MKRHTLADTLAVGANYLTRPRLLCTRLAPHEGTKDVLRLRYGISRKLKQSQRQFPCTKKRVPCTLLIASPWVLLVAFDAAACSPAGR